MAGKEKAVATQNNIEIPKEPSTDDATCATNTKQEWVQKPAKGATARGGRGSFLLSLLGLVAAIAGFGLVGKDIITLTSSTTGAVGAADAPASQVTSTKRHASALTLKNWTEALEASATPGPRVRALVESFAGGPAEKMAAIYSRVVSQWKYEPDEVRDRFVPVEELVLPGRMKGDCKHIAAVLYASAVVLGIGARMVATEGVGDNPGHVHTEILLCRSKEDPTATLATMDAVWSTANGRDSNRHPREFPLTWATEGVYLILDGGATPSKYQHKLGPVEAIISSGRP